VWITDFGPAKVSDQVMTNPGDIIGTLRYMPPEGFDGQADARGDIYSLGVTLYELLGLRPAFGDGDRRQLIKQVTTTDPPQLERINPAVPRDLAKVVHKAMEREPSHRYPTAGELADDLGRFLSDRPVRARPLSVSERTWRWCRHNRVVAMLTALIAAVLVLSASAGLIMSLILWDALDRTVQAKAETQDKLWLANYEQARAVRLSRQIGQRTDSLAAVVDAARIRPDERLRDEAIAALALPDVRLGPVLDALHGVGRMTQRRPHALSTVCWRRGRCDLHFRRRWGRERADRYGPSAFRLLFSGDYAIWLKLTRRRRCHLAIGDEHQSCRSSRVAGCGLQPDGCVVTALTAGSRV
jgi:hypothetical protein